MAEITGRLNDLAAASLLSLDLLADAQSVLTLAEAHAALLRIPNA